MPTRRRRLLGVVGLDPVGSSAVSRVVDVLAAGPDHDVALLAPDPDSRWLLTVAGTSVVEIPERLRAGVIELPVGGGAAYPVPALWPAALAATPQAVEAGHAAADDALQQSWRSRTSAVAYGLHRAAPFDLAVCAPRSAGGAAALMLATECSLPLLVLLDAEPSEAAVPLLDSAASAWVPDDVSAQEWRRFAPDVAAQVRAVPPDQYAAALHGLLEQVAP